MLDRTAARLIGTAFHRWTPDVILAVPAGALLVAWLRWRRRPAVPVVGYEFSAADRQCAHWYPPELPGIVNKLAAMVAGCEASRHGVASYHGFTGRTAVIPPLVPEATPQPLPLDPHKLGCIARLCVEKGLDYLLAALPELRRRHPQVSLHVYGEGYDRTRLEDLARALGVDDRVILAGRFDPSTGLDEVTAHHAIFVQPSLYEGMPSALLEVAARGRVVVASRVGGIPEFFAAGGKGALVRPAYPEDIAEAASALLGDPARLARLGRCNAAVVAERYGYRQALDALEHFLRAVVLDDGAAGRR